MSGMGLVDESREVRVIDISEFESRRAEIADQLWRAATEIGFFQLKGHGLSQEEIDAVFDRYATVRDTAARLLSPNPLSIIQRMSGPMIILSIKPSACRPNPLPSARHGVAVTPSPTAFGYLRQARPHLLSSRK